MFVKSNDFDGFFQSLSCCNIYCFQWVLLDNSLCASRSSDVWATSESRSVTLVSNTFVPDWNSSSKSLAQWYSIKSVLFVKSMIHHFQKSIVLDDSFSHRFFIKTTVFHCFCVKIVDEISPNLSFSSNSWLIGFQTSSNLSIFFTILAQLFPINCSEENY